MENKNGLVLDGEFFEAVEGGCEKCDLFERCDNTYTHSPWCVCEYLGYELHMNVGFRFNKLITDNL